MKGQNSGMPPAPPRGAVQYFEQELLRSAQADAPPHSAEEAWGQFSNGVAMVSSELQSCSTLATPSSVVSPAISPAISSPVVSPPDLAILSAPPVASTVGLAAKWWIVGTLTGASASAYLLNTNTPGAPSALPAVQTFQEISMPPELRLTLPTKPPVRSTEPSFPLKSAAHKTHQRKPHRVKPKAPPVEFSASAIPATAIPAAAPASPLAAEIRFLDAARSASRRGHYTTALRTVEDYRRQFPHGTLLADAEVVAIEALTADNAKERARERAERFLIDHPDDPHARRVRQRLTSTLRPLPR